MLIGTESSTAFVHNQLDRQVSQICIILTSFTLVQVAPETQEVAPVHPVPPHCVCNVRAIPFLKSYKCLTCWYFSTVPATAVDVAGG